MVPEVARETGFGRLGRRFWKRHDAGHRSAIVVADGSVTEELEEIDCYGNYCLRRE